MIEPAAAWDAVVRPTRRIGHALEAHVRIGSTNDRARELLGEPDADGRVVVADEQTAGRGRRGRTWLSPPGLNLTASVALRPRLAAADAWQLGEAAALAAATACDAVAPVGLKWPNDLVAADGRKLGGLLIETMADGDALRGAVIGVGINANWRHADMPAEIRDGATSLADLAEREVDRAALLDRLLDALTDEVAALERGTSPIERYRDRCVTLGTAVSVVLATGTIHGRAVGLDEVGALVVDSADGRHVLSSGEVVNLRGGSGS
jgi:BirA family biotin operon repressor/biotin-[acetyl-CoA-carboxylase] ligase